MHKSIQHGYEVIYPEMLKEDYDALIEQLQSDEDIKTKQDVIQYIEDMVWEKDKWDAIPVDYIKRWIRDYRTPQTFKDEYLMKVYDMMAFSLEELLKNWSRTQWFEENDPGEE